MLTTTSRYFPDELSQWPQYLKNYGGSPTSTPPRELGRSNVPSPTAVLFPEDRRRHFNQAISPPIAIEQLSAKQTASQQVAIMQGLDQFRERIQPTHDLIGVKRSWVLNSFVGRSWHDCRPSAASGEAVYVRKD
jgi:hypothetical protein